MEHSCALGAGVGRPCGGAAARVLEISAGDDAAWECCLTVAVILLTSQQ